MKLLDYQQAFNAWDKTTEAMQKAVERWFSLYYRTEVTDTCDPCQRIAYTVVNKVVKAVFSEYNVVASDPFFASVVKSLDARI